MLPPHFATGAWLKLPSNPMAASLLPIGHNDCKSLPPWQHRDVTVAEERLCKKWKNPNPA